MKKILVIFLTFFLSACWSSNENANTNSAQNPSSAKVKEVSTANKKLIPYTGNAKPLDTNPETNPNIKVIKPEKSEEEIRKQEEKAPDDSTFKARLDAEGYTGTRTFKSHPKLLKIEKKQNGKETSLKAYLKNGKVYDVSEEKIANFRTAAPINILIAIGVEKKPEPKKQVNQEKLNELSNRLIIKRPNK